MTWPLVLENDHGIRPAGKPDACFYCRSKVGEPHARDCVCIVKRVEYEVLARLTPGGDLVRVGLWEADEPHSWSAADMEFSRNESSWCKDSARETIQWLIPQTQVTNLLITHPCACAPLELRPARIVDKGPLRAQ